MAGQRDYVIEHRGAEWCVLTEDKSRVLGCHDSEAKAQAQLAAIEASKARRKDHAALRDLKNVEIFRTGTWNGDAYGEADLDAIVAASNAVGFGIPLKAGHKDEPGAQALGWVENLRRDGATLLADLVSLPEKVYEAIKDRAYDAVSAEIFWDLERNGAKYPRALKALALLGAEIPAVDLKPLREVLALNAFVMPPATQAATYATELVTERPVPEPDPEPEPEPEPDPTPAAMTIPRALMAEICPSCADTMQAKKITALKIPRRADGTYNFDVLTQYAGFSQGLCDRFGTAEGFRTRCMEHLSGNVDDVGAFCNSLKQWCGLMSAKGGEVHTAEPHTMTTDDVRDGEIVVKLSDVTELRRKAAAYDRVAPLEEALQKQKRENDALAAQRREDRIAYKMRDVKIPAFRPYIRALYELAGMSPDAKTYALLDPKVRYEAEGLVEALVTELNKQAEVLFMTLSVETKKRDPDEPDDLQDKVDHRVRAYCRANHLDPKKDYKAALQAVLAADPTLKVEYSRA